MNQYQTPMQPMAQEAPIDSPMGNVMNAPYGSPTPSLDLPASLQGLLGLSSPQIGVNPGAIEPLSGAPVAPNPNAPLFDINAQPGFAQGGMVDPNMPMAGGMPTQGGMGMQGGMPMGVGLNPQMGGEDRQLNDQDIQMFMQQHPQQVQQIASIIQEAIQAGDISPQQMNMAEQLATVALQNPQMYPQMRQFMVSQGILMEEDIPAQYDEGLLFLIILGSRAAKSAGAGAGMPQTAPMEDMQSFADGGFVTPGSNAKDGGKVVGPGTGTSDSIPIRVSAGEYVIPAHIVQSKGKEFFDSMLEKYKK